MALTKISRGLLDTGVSDSSDATAITINSSEQVMIGTTDAGYPDYGDSLTVADVDGGGGNAGMTIRSGTSSYGTFYFSDATGTAAGTYAGKMQYNHSNNSMVFGTNSADRLTIDSSGNVGIGTTSPANSSGYSTLTLNDTTGGQILFQVGGSTLSGIGGTSALDLTAVGNRNIEFNTNSSERMRIDGSGNLLIGRTDITRLGNGHIIRGSDSVIFSRDSSGETMQVCRNASAGDFIQFFSNNVEKGSIEYNGTNTLYNQSSDGRLKNITGKARGLEVINKLNPVAFNWKESGKADEGLIAQEVQEIFPNAVSNIEREYLQMDYSKLVTPLIKAIQELSAKVEELESKINE